MVAFDADSVAKADRFAEAYAALARRRGLLFLDAAGRGGGDPGRSAFLDHRLSEWRAR